ncbi:hypothetical protein GCM10023194_81490 [Planotetraspora phitsanulokensis]|uniref:Uncharacterized protein n=2 Tax=Planotetraspora phitsanulokensis TaxID=575192 RepID=A0A8J3UQN5_9ACTN|nr:hypothetical protein [Planotetraspora phitsanulokensis]GII42885.1 hypothetical protein Pph01_78880 [Planotetraspora phitsanulokensis]
MPYTPNRYAAQIVRRLRDEGWTVNIPDQPYRSVYQLRLSKGPYFGTFDVSASKGRALRMSITWQPNESNRKAEGTSHIIGLLNCLPDFGWAQ